MTAENIDQKIYSRRAQDFKSLAQLCVCLSVICCWWPASLICLGFAYFASDKVSTVLKLPHGSCVAIWMFGQLDPLLLRLLCISIPCMHACWVLKLTRHNKVHERGSGSSYSQTVSYICACITQNGICMIAIVLWHMAQPPDCLILSQTQCMQDQDFILCG